MPKLVDQNFSQEEARAAGSSEIISQKIISSKDLLVVTQDSKAALTPGTIMLAPTADITIYADTLRIRGPISAPGKTVRITARVLQTEADGNGAGAAIHVDGKDGQDAPPLPVPKMPAMIQMAPGVIHCVGQNTPPTPGVSYPAPAAAGNHGGAGAKAGTVQVATTKLELVDEKLPFKLELTAIGGKGGNGSKGQDGSDGGKGGDGADGFKCLFTDEKPQNGARGGDGNPGGQGGDAGRGGSGNVATADILAFVPDPEGGFLGAVKGAQAFLAVVAGIATSIQPGADGTPGAGGAGGARGPGGNGGRELKVPQGGGGEYTNDYVTYPAGQVGPSGAPGAKGADGGFTGASPSWGSQRIVSVCPANELVPATYITRPWLTMILARADYDFLAAGDDLDSPHLAKAALRYLWLTELSEAHIKVNSAVDSGVHNVFQAATNRLKSLQAGLNYFGHSATFVPMGSVDFWTTQSKNALAWLKDFEPLYQDYIDLNKDQSARLAGLTATIKKSKARILELQQKMQEQTARLPALVEAIDALDVEILAQGTAVQADLLALQVQVQQAFGLSWKDLFAAIGSLAFMQGKALNKGGFATGKVLELGNSALNDIVADDGSKIKKSLMVSKLLTKGEDFATTDEGFKMAAHQISLSDANSVKLIHAKKDIDDLLDKIASWDGAQLVRATLDSYVDLVSARNLQVLDYNSLVRQVLQLETDVHTEERHVQELQGDQSAVDPDLTHAVNYMSFVYRLICGNFVKSLYLSMRAAAFWSLDKSFSLDLVTGGPVDPHQMNYATALGWQMQAVQKLNDAFESLGGSRQPLTGITHRLSAANLHSAFADFKAGKSVDLHFTMGPVTKPTTAVQSPFAGWADVRTNKVEVYLRGAKATGGAFHFILKHGGHETLVTPAGAVLSVAHASRTIGFQYTLDAATGAVANIKTPGDNLHLKDDNYAPVGPFTNWTLTVKPSLNPGLDLSGLTSIDLVFSGDARSFD